MAKSKIEWTDATWNPVTGCSHAGSPGCDSCYARTMARRLAGRYGYPEHPRHFDVTLHPERLEEPLKRKKPTMYFVVSMGDLFHEDIEVLDSTFIRDVFAIMSICREHTFQLLTKRPHVAYHMLTEGFADQVEWAVDGICGERGWCPQEFEWPLSNVWLGVTAENQKTANERIPLLLRMPAVVRFVSCEPLLGPVDLMPYFANNSLYKAQHYAGELNFHGEEQADGSIVAIVTDGTKFCDGIDLHWVIVGGESGSRARPMHPNWARSLRDQCQDAGTPFFFKGWGGWVPDEDGCCGPGYDFNSRHICLNLAGEQFDGWMEAHGENIAIVAKASKKAAGRLFDGREWNEFPEVNDGQS